MQAELIDEVEEPKGMSCEDYELRAADDDYDDDLDDEDFDDEDEDEDEDEEE